MYRSNEVLMQPPIQQILTGIYNTHRFLGRGGGVGVVEEVYPSISIYSYNKNKNSFYHLENIRLINACVH